MTLQESLNEIVSKMDFKYHDIPIDTIIPVEVVGGYKTYFKVKEHHTDFTKEELLEHILNFFEGDVIRIVALGYNTIIN